MSDFSRKGLRGSGISTLVGLTWECSGWVRRTLWANFVAYFLAAPIAVIT